MKTTLDIADDILIEAKLIATKRRTTLKALVEHALRREISPSDANGIPTSVTSYLETGPRGLPQMKRLGNERVTSEDVYQLMDDEGI